MATSAYSIAAVEYAPISADGSLPTTGWKKITPIADDAVTFDIPAMAVNNIRAQDVPGVFEVLPGDTDPVKLSFNQLQVDGAVAADMMGGTWDAATKKYEAPIYPVLKKWAFRITSQPLNDLQVIFWIRKANSSPNGTVSWVRNDLAKISYSATQLTPLNADGVPQSPWGFQTVPYVQTT